MPRSIINQLAEGLFFAPNDISYWTAQHFSLKETEYRFENAKNFNLRILELIDPKYENTIGSAIYFYDGTQNLSAHIPEVVWLCNMAVKVFMVDTCGFGKVEGELSLEGFINDSTEAVRKILSELVSINDGVILVGDFMGAVAALNASQNHDKRIKGMLLSNCPFSYKSYLVSQYGPGLGHLIRCFLPNSLSEPNSILQSISSFDVLITFKASGRVQPSEYKKLTEINNPRLSFLTLASNSMSAENKILANKIKQKIESFLK